MSAKLENTHCITVNDKRPHNPFFKGRKKNGKNMVAILERNFSPILGDIGRNSVVFYNME